MIWEEENYKAVLQERMENEARQWIKNKNNGIITVETVID